MIVIVASRLFMVNNLKDITARNEMKYIITITSSDNSQPSPTVLASKDTISHLTSSVWVATAVKARVADTSHSTLQTSSEDQKTISMKLKTTIQAIKFVFQTFQTSIVIRMIIISSSCVGTNSNKRRVTYHSL